MLGATIRLPTGHGQPASPIAVLQAIPHPVIQVDRLGVVRLVNPAAEQFFETGAVFLVGLSLPDLLPPGSPVFTMVDQARTSGVSFSEHELSFDTPRTGARVVNVDVAPIGEEGDDVVLCFQERSIARRMDQQLIHRNAARSVTAMAAMLAHEVRNPLSGIRGAAQLLEQSASEGDRPLAQLICDEADRILKLVNRMDMFESGRPMRREPVNIHGVLDHVRSVATAGFAAGITIHEAYDPSLPAVFGNRDMLVQVFLNLVKNAFEALPDIGGEITLQTGYQHGVRLVVPGTGNRIHLPLEIRVRDNGSGIPTDLWDHLFDPFVSTKAGGSGLGLALVAKIIDEHGGLIDFDTQPGRTEFRILLPQVP